MGLTRNLQFILSGHRKGRVCRKVVLFIVFVLVTFLPMFYVAFALDPNALSNPQNNKHNVRQFGHSNALSDYGNGAEWNQDLNVFGVPVGKTGNASVSNQQAADDLKTVNQTKWIVKTHEANETVRHRLALDRLKHTHSAMCPVWPKELIGKLPVKEDMTTTTILNEHLQLVSTGGLFRPPNCTARQKVAIIIPYRDRELHLQVLLAHLHTVLQRQNIQYGIYVLEMALPTQFNRGLLANVGFLTAASIADYTCFIIHDVDLILMDDRNMYRCGRVIRHLVSYSSQYEDNLPYLSYFGGVTAFSTEQFWGVNGFSNLFFGRGGEDDDMVTRIISTGSHFSRPKKTVGGYVVLKPTKPMPNPVNPHKMALLYSSSERKDVDGVKTVKYSRLALEFKRLYTWVLISVKEAKIMEKYQEFLQVPEHRANRTTTAV